MSNKYWLAVAFLIGMTGCTLEEVKNHGGSCPGIAVIMVDDDGYLVVETDYQIQQNEEGQYYVEPQYSYCDELGRSIENADGEYYESQRVHRSEKRDYPVWSEYVDWLAEKSRMKNKQAAEDRFQQLKNDLFKLQYIDMGEDGICYEEDKSKKCKNFKTSFSYQNCPEGFEQCAFSLDVGFYCKSPVMMCSLKKDCEGAVLGADEVTCDKNMCRVLSCKDGFLLKEDENICVASCSKSQYYDSASGNCLESDIENCGAKDYACSDHVANWMAGTCEDGVCRVSECNGGYRVKYNICASACDDDEYYDSESAECVKNDIHHCGSRMNDCTDWPGWGDGRCEQGRCVFMECKAGYHVLGNVCVEDTNGCCGPACVRCRDTQMCIDGNCEDICNTPEIACVIDDDIQCINPDTAMKHCGGCHQNCSLETVHGSEAVECMQGRCVATQCAETYHLRDFECVKDTQENCGGDINCLDVIANSEEMECVSGTCSVLKCKPNYHVSVDGQCEADSVDYCGAGGKKCAENAGWLSGGCEAGECVVSECKAGYHLSNDRKLCVENSASSCGVEGSSSAIDCTTAIANSNVVKCDAGVCRVVSCISGYHLSADGRSCKANTVTECGAVNSSTTVNCTTSLQNNDGVICDAGVCKLTACKPNYHIYLGNNSCEADSISHCGAHGRACSFPNATAQCVSGQCSIKSCNSNAHNYLNNCELDDVAHCGSHETNCTVANATYACTNKTCTYTCNGSYHNYNGGKCNEANDNTNCGAHGAACTTGSIANSTAVSCNGGKCQATACTDTYHVYNGTCEKTDVNNCLVHGAVCTTAQKPLSDKVACTSSDKGCHPTSCVTGASGYTSGACKCSSSHTQCGNSCPNLSTDEANCGGCGVVCDASKVPLSKEAACYSGKCQAKKSTDTTSYCVTHATRQTDGSCKCSSSYTQCGNSCVNTKTDEANCGGCGVICDTSKVPLSKKVTCSSGVCKASTTGGCVTNASRQSDGTCKCKSGFTQSGNACV